jgi:hypothetical protein
MARHRRLEFAAINAQMSMIDERCVEPTPHFQRLRQTDYPDLPATDWRASARHAAPVGEFRYLRRKPEWHGGR